MVVLVNSTIFLTRDLNLGSGKENLFLSRIKTYSPDYHQISLDNTEYEFSN